MAGTVTPAGDALAGLARGLRPGFSMPFGGVKASGIGRESGREVHKTCTEAKAVYRPVPA